MVVVFHPGYDPKAVPPTAPVASDVVGLLEASPEVCQRMIATWKASEKGFRVLKKCKNRTEAKQFIKDKGLRLLT